MIPTTGARRSIPLATIRTIGTIDLPAITMMIDKDLDMVIVINTGAIAAQDLLPEDLTTHVTTAAKNIDE